MYIISTPSFLYQDNTEQIIAIPDFLNISALCSCQSCMSTCEVYCETGCEVCLNCETSCEKTTCQSSCQTSCQTICEKNTCQTCQTTCESYCQNCQGRCEAICEKICETLCEGYCQTSCEGSCENQCEKTCENCQGVCQDGCQLFCENCQGVTCQTCQGCQTVCEKFCEDACQQGCEMCEGCESGCMTTCETLGCQTNSQVPCSDASTCQSVCETLCEGSCEGICETSCEHCQDRCQSAGQAGGGCGTTQAISTWNWSSGVQNAIDNKGKFSTLSAIEINDFINRVKATLKKYKKDGIKITIAKQVEHNLILFNQDVTYDTMLSACNRKGGDYLTAQVFNSIVYSIGQWESLNINKQLKGNIVKGLYFNQIKTSLNSFIKKVNELPA